MRRRSFLYRFLVFLIVLPTTGCLFHTHSVQEKLWKEPLLESSQQGLISEINGQADRIHSLQATVDIDASAGGVKKGQVTDYKEIRGYVLARKPAMLHMIGLMPFVRTTAFDMVSNGQTFELWIPPKNRFVMGNNKVQAKNPDKPMENIRPNNIYDALFINKIEPPEVAVLENSQMVLHDNKHHTVLQDDYELLVIRMINDRDARLSRKIVFSRIDLRPTQQFIYNDQGQLITEAQYADYKQYGDIVFPSRMEIFLPQEEYDFKMNVLKLELNKHLTDDQFTLAQPPGAEVVHLDHPQASSNSARSPIMEVKN